MLPLEAAASGSTTGSTIVVVLAALGIGSVVTAVVTGLFSKRKLGAEATEIITNAASSVVKTLEAQLARGEQERHEDQTRHEMEMTRITVEHAREMTNMARAHTQERDAWKKVLQLHVAWDALAISKLAEMDFDMPPTPPLTPAEHFVDDKGYPING
jgi:DNA-directed RNA polymerase